MGDITKQITNQEKSTKKDKKRYKKCKKIEIKSFCSHSFLHTSATASASWAAFASPLSVPSLAAFR